MDKQELRSFWKANLFDGVEGGPGSFPQVTLSLDDLVELSEIIYKQGYNKGIEDSGG